jgi:hypothetical protein
MLEIFFVSSLIFPRLVPLILLDAIVNLLRLFGFIGLIGFVKRFGHLACGIFTLDCGCGFLGVVLGLLSSLGGS